VYCSASVEPVQYVARFTWPYPLLGKILAHSMNSVIDSKLNVAL